MHPIQLIVHKCLVQGLKAKPVDYVSVWFSYSTSLIHQLIVHKKNL
jgi:hypothetical protein